MVAGTQRCACLILPVNAACLQEARFSYGALQLLGAYLTAFPDLCWLLTGSKPSDGGGPQAEVDLSGSPCPCWLLTESKPSDGSSGMLGLNELHLPVHADCPQEVSLLIVVASKQRWIYNCCEVL